MHLPFSFSPCLAAIARCTIAVCRVSKRRLDSISVFHFQVNRIANEYLLRHWWMCRTYIHICLVAEKRKESESFSTWRILFRKSFRNFLLFTFNNKLVVVHHGQTELLFSSNSNLVTVLIVHEMLRCKSVESFGRSQYTTFSILLLIVRKIPFDIQSGGKKKYSRTINNARSPFQKNLFSSSGNFRFARSQFQKKTLAPFHFGRMKRR